jgi:hypothetical protein
MLIAFIITVLTSCCRNEIALRDGSDSFYLRLLLGSSRLLEFRKNRVYFFNVLVRKFLELSGE